MIEDQPINMTRERMRREVFGDVPPDDAPPKFETAVAVAEAVAPKEGETREQPAKRSTLDWTFPTTLVGVTLVDMQADPTEKFAIWQR
jgi:hypothetical protein